METDGQLVVVIMDDQGKVAQMEVLVIRKDDQNPPNTGTFSTFTIWKNPSGEWNGFVWNTREQDNVPFVLDLIEEPPLVLKETMGNNFIRGVRAALINPCPSWNFLAELFPPPQQLLCIYEGRKMQPALESAKTYGQLSRIWLVQ